MHVRRRCCWFLCAVCGCISLRMELLFVGEQGEFFFFVQLSILGECLRKTYLPNYLRNKWCSPFKIDLNSNAVSDRFHLGVQTHHCTLTTQTRNLWWHSLCLLWLAFTWTLLDLSTHEVMCTYSLPSPRPPSPSFFVWRSPGLLKSFDLIFISFLIAVEFLRFILKKPWYLKSISSSVVRFGIFTGVCLQIISMTFMQNCFFCNHTSLVTAGIYGLVH